jgi:hypothetical protein
MNYFGYHRNNGISKLGLVAVDDADAFFVDEGKTSFMIRSAEAAMVLSDKMNNAYIRAVFEDTYIVSGQ